MNITNSLPGEVKISSNFKRFWHWVVSIMDNFLWENGFQTFHYWAFWAFIFRAPRLFFTAYPIFEKSSLFFIEDLLLWICGIIFIPRASGLLRFFCLFILFLDGLTRFSKVKNLLILRKLMYEVPMPGYNTDSL